MKKILVIGIIGLLVLSFSFAIYDYNNDENIKATLNEWMGQDCEYKDLGDGWFRIKDCAVYRMTKLGRYVRPK